MASPSPTNPPCSIHPPSQILFHCSLCNNFLCVHCISSHYSDTGHSFSGKEYDQYLQEKISLLKDIKSKQKLKEENRSIYEMIKELVDKTLQEFDGSIGRKVVGIQKVCEEYRERVERVREQAEDKLKGIEEKGQERESATEFEKALEEVKKGRFEKLGVVQRFFLMEEGEEERKKEKSVKEWVKEVRLTQTLSCFGENLKKMYKQFKGYFQVYLEKLAKLEERREREEQEEEEEKGKKKENEEKEYSNKRNNKKRERKRDQRRIKRKNKKSEDENENEESQVKKKVHRERESDEDNNYNKKSEQKRKIEKSQQKQRSKRKQQSSSKEPTPYPQTRPKRKLNYANYLSSSEDNNNNNNKEAEKSLQKSINKALKASKKLTKNSNRINQKNKVKSSDEDIQSKDNKQQQKEDEEKDIISNDGSVSQKAQRIGENKKKKRNLKQMDSQSSAFDPDEELTRTRIKKKAHLK